MPKYAFTRIHLFGGTPLIRRLADELTKSYLVHVWIAPRQFNEAFPDYTDRGYAVVVTDDIDKVFHPEMADGALGIGLGEAWQFGKAIRDAFGDRLVDFMSIPFPYYLGGAHLTHAVLRGEEQWGNCMQLVTENTKQGEVHDGEIIHQTDISVTYTEAHDNRTLHKFMEDRSFTYLVDFVRQAARGEQMGHHSPGFVRSPHMQEMVLPRLNTREQAWVDWSWTRDEIVRFIRAFDDPYPGARTHLLTDEGPKVVTLHEVKRQYKSASHPFHAGLVLGRCDGAWLVAVRDGSFVVEMRIDGEPFKGPAGVRLFTRRELLDDALVYQPNYNALGDANASRR